MFNLCRVALKDGGRNSWVMTDGKSELWRKVPLLEIAIHCFDECSKFVATEISPELLDCFDVSFVVLFCVLCIIFQCQGR